MMLVLEEIKQASMPSCFILFITPSLLIFNSFISIFAPLNSTSKLQFNLVIFKIWNQILGWNTSCILCKKSEWILSLFCFASFQSRTLLKNEVAFFIISARLAKLFYDSIKKIEITFVVNKKLFKFYWKKYFRVSLSYFRHLWDSF